MAGYAIPLNNATYPLIFHLFNATDGQSPVTGATATVTLSKDGGAYAAPAGAVSEIGNGDYKVAANATDANALGPLVLNATATGAAPASVTFLVVAYNPFDSAALGLSRVDAAISTRATPAQILTTPANLLATDVSGKVGANNLPADYQQRGVAVTLPSTVVPSADQTAIATAVIASFRAAPINNAPVSHTYDELQTTVWAIANGTITESGTGITYKGTDGVTTVVTYTMSPSIAGATGRTTSR